MLVLRRLLQRDTFDEIEGCVSTGKEANVYHALTGDGKSLAVKVYKTSILIFRDRDRYVSGEFRLLNLVYCIFTHKRINKLTENLPFQYICLVMFSVRSSSYLQDLR